MDDIRVYYGVYFPWGGLTTKSLWQREMSLLCLFLKALAGAWLLESSPFLIDAKVTSVSTAYN